MPNKVVSAFPLILLFLFMNKTLLFGGGTLALTGSEREWIAQRREPVKIGITVIPNQVIPKKGGGYDGYAIDLFKKIAGLTGLSFDFVYYPSWNDLIVAARKREIDAVFLAQKTPSRLSYLDFTDRVLSLKNKVIVNIREEGTGGIGDLDKAKIAVTKGSALEEYLVSHYPRAEIVPVDNLLEALKMVSDGKVDAVVAEPVRAGYFMKKYNLDNLLIAENLGYDYALGVASRSDIPVLNVVLSKAVDAITPAEYNAMRLKWGYVRRTVLDKKTLAFLGVIFVLSLLFFIYLYVTNRRLKKEIAAKQEAMRRLNILLEEQKRLEETLQERIAEEVEKNRQQEIFMFQQNRLAQMGELLSMIAHQWRQPLNNLSLANQLILTRYARGRLDDKTMAYFKKVAKEHIEHMSATIDDFKNFYKIEEKKAWFDVGETVLATLQMVRPALEKEKIDLRFEIEEHCQAFGYQNGLSQVILNLVNNAKDALATQSDLCREITVWVRADEKSVEIVVEDNAGGVPEEIMEKIFDPYFSTKGEKHGTGLGLYMSRKIVEEQLDGRLSVSNTEYGARFVVKLFRKESR